MSRGEVRSLENNLYLKDPHADPYDFLGLKLNPDGSLTRVFDFPTRPASSDPNHHDPVLTKDLTINQVNKTFVRIFLPRELLDSPDPVTRLPLIVEFHGGGFTIDSAASEFYHPYYTLMATQFPGVIAAVEYRRCPDHRLPAAYDDGMEALHVIKNSNHQWLTKYADFSNCYLSGCSAGANLVYNLGLRVTGCVEDLKPLHIKGLMMLQPWFGGIERTESEVRLIDDKIAPLCVTDILWGIVLPVGADRDHEYSNPVGKNRNDERVDEMKRLGWKILVKGCDGDPLVDRQKQLVKMLEDKGLQVVASFDQEGYHGIEERVPEKTKAYIRLAKQVFDL